MFNYQSPWYLSYQKSKSVLLNEIKLTEQCCHEIGDTIKKEKNNFETNVVQDTPLQNFETVRAVPSANSVLKNNSRANRKIFSQLNEIDENENHVQISFIPENTSEEPKCFKKETKYKHLYCARRKGFDFSDVWHEFPGWNTEPTVKNKKISKKSLPTSGKLKTNAKQRKITRCAKKNIKHDVPHFRTKQNEDSYNVPTSFTSEYICLQELDSTDLQDPIDFSSNEIFSKFNYELYGDTSLTGLGEYMNDSKETYNSMYTNNDNDMFEKEYDLNSNETDITSEAGYRFSTTKSSRSLEYLDNDILLLDNRKLHWTGDTYNGHCLENCVSNWLTANETRNNLPQKDKMLTAALNPNIIHMSDEIDLDSADIYDIYLATDTSPKGGSTRNDTDNIDLSLTDLSNFYDEFMIEEILKETVNSDQKKKFHTDDDLDDVLFEINFDTPTLASGKEINESSVVTLQSEEDYEYITNNKKFQCSICSLTFTNARTFAMHRAGAHEGMYAILCESCGTLFNRKYHFNRHLVYCSRSKKAFRCDMCMKAYRHKSTLVHHLKESHSVHYEREPNFTCGVCNKTYSRFGAFENHLKKHQHGPGKLTYCENS